MTLRGYDEQIRAMRDHVRESEEDTETGRNQLAWNSLPFGKLT